jgi:hypothetical protein
MPFRIRRAEPQSSFGAAVRARSNGAEVHVSSTEARVMGPGVDHEFFDFIVGTGDGTELATRTRDDGELRSLVARRANLTAPDHRDDRLPVDFLLAAFLEAVAFLAPVDFLLAAFLEAVVFLAPVGFLLAAFLEVVALLAPVLAAAFFGAAFFATAFVRTAHSGRAAGGA